MVDESDVIQLTFTLKLTTVHRLTKTSVTVNNNSPIQDYVHPDHHTQHETSLCDIGSKGQIVTSEYVTRLPMTSGVETFKVQI